MPKRKRRIPITAQKWIPPTKEPKFKIGDRVMMSVKSTVIPSGTIGIIYGVLYKSEPIISGFWYDIHFDGFIAHHTLGEPLLKGVKNEH